MPGCSSARSDDARVSVTSSPARRSAASSSGRESGLRPGASNAVAHLGDQRLEPLRPGTARRPRPEQVGEQALVDVDPPRHPGVRHLGRDQGTRGLRREQQPEPGGLGRRRHGGQLPGVLEVGAQVLGRVVDREQRRVGRRARPEPVPVLRLLAPPAAARPPRAPAAAGGGRAAGRGSARPAPRPPAAAGTTARCRPTPSAARRPRARARTPAGRPAPARRSAPPSTTSTRSPGRRESETRVMGTPWHRASTAPVRASARRRSAWVARYASAPRCAARWSTTSRASSSMPWMKVDLRRRSTGRPSA